MTFFPTTGLQYWLSSSPFMQAGQVISAAQTQDAVQLSFPPGIDALTATLNRDGTWTTVPS
jgi:hypothetical protein